MEFLSKNVEWLITIIVGVTSWLVSLGIAYYRLSALEKKLADVDMNGSRFSREAIKEFEVKHDGHIEKITAIETDTKMMLKQLGEINTAIAVLTQSVNSMKGNGRRN